MSQDPLGSIKRRQPRKRGTFPEARYQREWLLPAARHAEDLLGDSLVEVFRAHAVMLAEQRIVEPEIASRIIASLDEWARDNDALPHHALSRIESQVSAGASGEIMLGYAREEVTVAAMRMVLRRRMIDLIEALIDARDALAELAAGHLTTLMLPTANGQVVQPTSLGHYLTGQIGPLSRTCQRLQEAYVRVNQSPLGAGSGMSTAMPIRRGRVSELLCFESVIESTFDAIAATDAFSELVAIVAAAAVESSRMVADLTFWARDDVGLLVPGDEYLHAGSAQPQRRDPAVLDHLRSQIAMLCGLPVQLSSLLIGQSMLGSEVTRLEAFFIAEKGMSAAAGVYELLAAVVRSAVVNRALFAHRTNRGFPTSSELADLLSVDFRLPRRDAMLLAEKVVIEATEAGGEATTLTSEFIDTVALRVLGREIGIEQEMLAKCLAPKRFVERRDVTGAPAPKAVSAALDRETFASRRDRGWIADRRRALDDARRSLAERAQDIARDPAAVARRRE